MARNYRIPEDQLREAYLVQNLTRKECAEKFNVTPNIVDSSVVAYNLRKTKEQMHDIYCRAADTKNHLKGIHTLAELVQLIPKEEFYNIFIKDNRTLDFICNYYHITSGEFYKLQNYYGYKKTQIQARAAGMLTLNQESFKAVCERLDPAEFRSYYVDENHTTEETLKHFNITISYFYNYQHKYDIYKPKNKQVELCLHAKGLETFDEILSRINKQEFIDDYNNMIQSDLETKYNLSSINFYYLLDYYNLPRKACHYMSSVNNSIAKLLKENNIDFTIEYMIYYNLPEKNYYRYDFKIGDILLEVNPTFTHSPRKICYDPVPISYHIDKTKAANAKGFRCIHIWDWDDINKVIAAIKSTKDKLYARDCSISEVNKKDIDDFLNRYHFQNTCKGQSIALGLYHNNQLVEVMTFGKPRYNKKYQYELLRLCTDNNYYVIGGAEKLFKHFIDNYNPDSIVSYCDLSKFDGHVYKRLGFNLIVTGTPSKHWCNIYTKMHVTDNLLRQRGFDQLFNTNYGKGTSNEQLMLDHNFVDIYDCGQATYVWEKQGDNVF